MEHSKESQETTKGNSDMADRKKTNVEDEGNKSKAKIRKTIVWDIESDTSKVMMFF